MTRISLRLGALSFAFVLLAGCAGTSTGPAAFPTPTIHPSALIAPSGTTTTVAEHEEGANVSVRIDTGDSHPISPLIYGLSGAPDDVLSELRPALNSWGGNTSTRYNYRLGNAWNAARDWFYRNGDYGYRGASASDDFIAETLAAGAEVRLALPTLGWVAKNNDQNTCSFPTPDGQCSNADLASCDKPGTIADPTLANEPSDVAGVGAWMQQMVAENGFRLRFIAMDNEPELWGSTHYDVHPTCPTYDEILGKYLEYATAARAAAPQAELLGPVTCCWYFYWNSAAGMIDKVKHGGQDFLPWFLDQVRAHDEQTATRTLDVLDIHYYPEGLYNDNADPATAAHRLRSTRSLWDATYVDESWIAEPVALIPRMRAAITGCYPGLKLGISEWNWGADKTMNGALAIADVLGIFGRENLYLASYWRYPEPGSAGFYAFKLYTNYDGQGSRFGDTSVQTTSSAPAQVGSYAALNSATSTMTVMLINKEPQHEQKVALGMYGFAPAEQAMLYRISEAAPAGIAHSRIALGDGLLTLPASSISLLVLERKQP